MKVKRNTLLLLASLLLAGVLFGCHYGRAVFADAVEKKAGNKVENKGGKFMQGKENMKRYINTALLYAIFAMAGGVFYREFTKFNGFDAKTTLSVVHTHYFLLGMAFFLLLLMAEKSFSFTSEKTRRALVTYHIGLNLTAVMLVVRGVAQVLMPALSSGMDAAISGVAGIGHILLGVSLVLLLVQLRRSVSAAQG